MGVVTGVIATVLISVFAAATSAFSKINAGNGAAFRVLLGMVFVGALAALATLAAAVFYGRKLTAASAGMATEARESKSAVLAEIKSLESSIARVDWSYDAAEHDAAFYERLRQVVDNPRTMEFRAVTVFRDPRFQEVDDQQRDAIRGYYTALENALAGRRGFVYERTVVMHGALGAEKPPAELFKSLMLARPDFLEHVRKVMRGTRHALGARADIKFYGDTGRLLDVAFAVALDARREPVTLALEIGTTAPGNRPGEPHHPVLGLLALENPDRHLTDAFLLAYQSMRSGDAGDLGQVPRETVRDTVWARLDLCG